jgi:hypothetical protein
MTNHCVLTWPIILLTPVLPYVDVVQGLISKYASIPFEVTVAWVERDGREYPVIIAPPGVKVPVVCKRDLRDEKGQSLLKVGAVYFRTLASNGTPSSSEAKPEDWSEIIEICFENREADVGRFVRRNLAGLDFKALSAILGKAVSPPETLREKSLKLMEDGEARFPDV